MNIGRYLNPNVSVVIKNISFLVSGQIITQIISFIGVAFIARKLGVENYGIYTTVITYVGLFSLLNLSGSYKVIIREGSKDLKSLHKIIEKLVGIKALFAILSISATIITALFIDSYTLQLKYFIILYSLTHIYNIYNSFNFSIFQASQKMQYISYLSILVSFSYTASAAIAVQLGYGVLSLLIINIIVNGLSLIIGYIISRNIVKFKLFKKPHWDKKLLIPSFLFTILGLFGLLQTKIDLLMISWMGTVQEVAIYAVAYKITTYFESVRNQVSNAFYPVIVKRYHKGPIKLSFLIKTSLVLALGVIIFCSIFSFFTTDIILLIFGSEYRASGYILSILIFNFGFRFTTFPFSTSLISTDNEKYVVAYEGLTAVFNVVLNYILYQIYGLIGIAYASLVSSGIRTLAEVIIAIILLKRQKRIH